MKVDLVVIGRAGHLLAASIHEYERRASRYWRLDVIEVPAARGGAGRSTRDVVSEEAKRVLARVDPSLELIALSRTGARWDSVRLTRFLEGLAVHARPGACFVIGGAGGLAAELLDAAAHRLALSDFTLPHDLARLLILEQLYRAGTISRGEPYHRTGVIP